MFAGLFGDWDLEIPHLRSVIKTGANWYGNGSGTPNLNRCSQFSPPPATSVVGGSKTYSVSPYQYWDGHQLYVPGEGGQTMLSRAAYVGGPVANPIQPSDGLSYLLVTKQHWQVRCLPTLDTGTGGEAFLALAPDGTRYQFDHMVTRTYPSFKAATGANLARTEVWIMPTQVTDRFGNWVRYTYGGADGWRVMSIASSDGRTITLGYSGNGNRIASVNDGTRTWNYAYDGNGGLQTVTQPDSSQWQFVLGQLERDPFSSPDPDCNGDDVFWDPTTRTGTITHPSGAVGTFNLKMTMHGRSNVPGNQATCSAALASRYFTNYSVSSKTLSGPGMPAMTWSYAYSDAYGSYAPCSGCVNTKTVTTTDPLGNVVQNTYGTQFGINDGLLLSGAEGVTSNGTLRSTSYGYQASNAGPYPSLVGYNGGYSDSMSVIFTPRSQRTINQQGVSFTQTVAGFDGYARATGITRSSGLGYSRNESTVYYDHTGLWVLGQVASQAIAGIQASSISFDGSTALPTASYKFGKLQGTYGFNADGTLASITDPLNHATTFSNYVRGLPQNVHYADNTGIGGYVNNLGNLTSTIDEAGQTWSFTYDSMGRLASKTPPGGDGINYNPTTLAFVQVPYAEYGLDAGHWRQTITTGAAVTAHYFDARWRKRITITYDANNPGGTQRMQRFDYDPYNRTTFAAYPARTISSIAMSTPGTTTAYDALGRQTQSLADSELGTLTTTIQYLGSFQRQVTNPRGYTTTTAYQAFDEPSESAITNIAAPRRREHRDQPRRVWQAAEYHARR